MKNIKWENVYRDHKKGMTIEDIAGKLCMGINEVKKEFAARGYRQTRINDERYIQIFNELYKDSSNTLDMVSEKTGVRVATLGYNFSRLGLKKNNVIRLMGCKDNPIFFNGKKYTADYRGRYRTTTKPQHFLKRDVWEFHKGELPKGSRIFLINHDEANCSIENLTLKEKDNETVSERVERCAFPNRRDIDIPGERGQERSVLQSRSSGFEPKTVLDNNASQNDQI